MKKILPLNYWNLNFFQWIVLVLILSAFSNYSTAQITTGFELDGNAVAVSPNPPDDWDLIFNDSDNAQITTGILIDMPSVPSNSDDQFTIGAKDINDIDTWGWSLGNVADKSDIRHAGAALYDDCKLYFFADRFTVNGNASLGFWFFKNPVTKTDTGSAVFMP